MLPMVTLMCTLPQLRKIPQHPESDIKTSLSTWRVTPCGHFGKLSIAKIPIVGYSVTIEFLLLIFLPLELDELTRARGAREEALLTRRPDFLQRSRNEGHVLWARGWTEGPRN